MTGLPDPHVAMKAVGMPGDPRLNGEPVLLQDVDDVPIGLGLLKAELPEAEDRVDHLLRELAARLHIRRRPPA